MTTCASRFSCCFPLLLDLPNSETWFLFLAQLLWALSFWFVIIIQQSWLIVETPRTWTGDWSVESLTDRPQAVQTEPPTTSACRSPPSAPRQGGGSASVPPASWRCYSDGDRWMSMSGYNKPLTTVSPENVILFFKLQVKCCLKKNYYLIHAGSTGKGNI